MVTTGVIKQSALASLCFSRTVFKTGTSIISSAVGRELSRWTVGRGRDATRSCALSFSGEDASRLLLLGSSLGSLIKLHRGAQIVMDHTPTGDAEGTGER